MTDKDGLAQLMDRIDESWLSGRPGLLEEFFDENITMRHPGFRALTSGKKGLIESFKEFLQNAVVRSYKKQPYSIDVVGSVAVISFEFEMVYELEKQYLSRGRDTWVFHKTKDRWVAVWRMMSELSETEISQS